MIKIGVFLVNRNMPGSYGRRELGPAQRPSVQPKPEAAGAARATEPATAAAALQAAAHAQAPPTEAARGQAPRARYSPRHPLPGMAALRGAGCGIFSPATAPGRAARAAARDTAQDTQPCGARLHGPRHGTHAPASEDDVTARGLASRRPGWCPDQRRAELSCPWEP